MPDWKKEISRRIAGLKLAPARESEIVEELAHELVEQRVDPVLVPDHRWQLGSGEVGYLAPRV